MRQQKVETIRKGNACKIKEIASEHKRYIIERREIEEKAKGDARVEEVKVVSQADVALKKAKGDDQVRRVQSQQKAEALLKSTQVKCQSLKIDAEKTANVNVKLSEAQLKVAESQAGSMIAKAEAEAEGAEALAEKRRFELEWARLDVMKKIAQNGRKFITGDAGEAILNDLVPQKL